MRDTILRRAALVMLVVLSAVATAGCYQFHGLDDDVSGLLTVTVQTQAWPLPSRPATHARVVVEDCDTGQLEEATTDADGVAHFTASRATCWTVTAVMNGFARSVLRAPVPLPGPIVFPQPEPAPAPDAETGPVLTWELELPDAIDPRPAGEELNADVSRLDARTSVPGLIARNWGSLHPMEGGTVAADTVLRENVGVVYGWAPNGEPVGQLFTFDPPVNGVIRARANPWTSFLTQREANITVHLNVGGVYSVLHPTFYMSSEVIAVGPSGSEYKLGASGEGVADQRWTSERLSVHGTFGWVVPVGAETWIPTAGRRRDYWLGADACETRVITWGSVVVSDGQMHETVIPIVERRQVGGTSVDTLDILFGGAGHRATLVLRVAGDAPFEWTIDSFETGAAHFSGVPPLPSGVAEAIGLHHRSVYVQYGVTAPTAASFAPSDPSERTVPWWIRQGFVFGSVSDFGPSVAGCTEVP